MYTLIIFFPIFSFFVSILFGRFLGSELIQIFNPLSIFLSLVTSIFCFYEVVLCGYSCTITIFNWVQFGMLEFNIELLFDSLSASMLIVVLSISFFVHLYSVEYMSEDPHLIRFLSYLTIFTIFMLFFVLSSNFIQLFLGWEGIGLASYLLVNFWYTRVEANRSALKAVILNRFGDFGLYMSILILFYLFKSLDFCTIFALSHYIYNFNNYIIIFNYSFYFFSLISFFLFLGAIGKSAQIGLHIWLPDAMEGPTPVSALIHAATMVTAGVFLLIRCSPILEFSKNILIIIMFFGALTAFFSSTIGIVQNDIKKVIAYSTCSQLGYMIFACGASNYFASFFHLFNHAFFKALLFLGAGSVIHSMSNEQDLRKYGGLLNLLPFTYSIFLIGSLSLVGFPFLSGFYSKDIIIEFSYSYFSISGLFVYWLGSLSVFFTTFYSFRLIYLTFFFEPNSFKKNLENIHESGILITITLTILSLCSIFFGYLFSDLFVGLGTDSWNNSIYSGIESNNYFLIEMLPLYIKLCPLFFSILGFITFLLFYRFYISKFIFYKNEKIIQLYSFLSKKWYFDFVYFWFLVRPFLFIVYDIFFKIIDRGFFELFGPLGLVRFLNKKSFEINNLQKGHVSLTVFIFIFFLLSLFLFYYFILFYFFKIKIILILFLFYLFISEFKEVD